MRSRAVLEPTRRGSLDPQAAKAHPADRERWPRPRARGAILVKLVSTAATGFFYVKRRNPKKNPVKLEFMKYDPRVRRHVLFTEQKINK